MNDIKKLVVGICTLIEVGCITGLAVIGLKRNNDCYKAEMKLVDAECDLCKKEIELIYKDAEIRSLEKQLKDLKKEKEHK